jgi:hypothetical protein
MSRSRVTARSAVHRRDDRRRRRPPLTFPERRGSSWFVKNVSTSFRTDCLHCHTVAKATDWVLVMGFSPAVSGV